MTTHSIHGSLSKQGTTWAGTCPPHRKALTQLGVEPRIPLAVWRQCRPAIGDNMPGSILLLQATMWHIKLCKSTLLLFLLSFFLSLEYLFHWPASWLDVIKSIKKTQYYHWFPWPALISVPPNNKVHSCSPPILSSCRLPLYWEQWKKRRAWRSEHWMNP